MSSPPKKSMKNVLLLIGALVLLVACTSTGPIAIQPGTGDVAPQYIGTDLTPLREVPDDRWGSPPKLEPEAVLVDSTWLQFEPGSTAVPFDVAIRGENLYLAAGTGLRFFNISDPSAPVLVRSVYGKQIAGAYWQDSDEDYYFLSIKALHTLAIVTTQAKEFGFFAFTGDLSNWHYQDAGTQGHNVTSVHAARLSDGRDYAFGLALSQGVTMYDLTSAATVTRCLENARRGETGCGVYEGLLADSKVAGIGGIDDYLVVRSGNTDVRIYYVPSPASFASAQPILSATLPGSTAGDAILWRYDYDGDGVQGLYMAALTSVYVAPVVASTLRVYDVTCVVNGACGLPNPLRTYDITDGSKKLAKMTHLSLSYDDATPYLYIGNANSGLPQNANCVGQREFLLDFGRFNPAAPPPLATLDVSPPDYWGWYYPACYDSALGETGPGFNNTTPMRARVKDGYVYRAARSFSDSHKILSGSTDPPPPPVPPPPTDPPPPGDCTTCPPGPPGPPGACPPCQPGKTGAPGVCIEPCVDGEDGVVDEDLLAAMVKEEVDRVHEDISDEDLAVMVDDAVAKVLYDVEPAEYMVVQVPPGTKVFDVTVRLRVGAVTKDERNLLKVQIQPKFGDVRTVTVPSLVLHDDESWRFGAGGDLRGTANNRKVQPAAEWVDVRIRLTAGDPRLELWISGMVGGPLKPTWVMEGELVPWLEYAEIVIKGFPFDGWKVVDIDVE